MDAMGDTHAEAEGAVASQPLWLTNPRWEGDPEVVHGQTTRHFAPPETTAQRCASRVREELGAEEFVSVLLGQVHGRKVAFVGSRSLRRADGQVLTIAETDGVVTDLPGVLLHLQTADCVPILMRDPTQSLVGAAHAGWKGTAKKIAANLVREMAHRGADVERLEVWLGASIGGPCYEVGPEVLKRFTAVNNWWPGIDNDQRRVDLAMINRLQIARSGVPPENMVTSPLCTSKRLDLLHSHRREPDCPGRMHAVIGLRAQPD